MKNIKLHVCVMLMIVIAELIGVKSFSVGPGKIVLLPMLYALIIGIFPGPTLKDLTPISSAIKIGRAHV